MERLKWWWFLRVRHGVWYRLQIAWVRFKYFWPKQYYLIKARWHARRVAKKIKEKGGDPHAWQLRLSPRSPSRE